MIFLFLLAFIQLHPFDYKYYLESNPDLKGSITNAYDAINHYYLVGKKTGRQGVKENITPTNFDWEYYKSHNNLEVKNEADALEHYKQIGKAKNLPTHKKFKILILLHLYYKTQLQDYLNRINNFTAINPDNEYYFKINIPFNSPPALALKQNFENIIYTQLKIPKERIQILYSENQGMDIGGFFLLLDEVFKENLDYDFFIKLHTKKNKIWRDILTSFLNIPINTLLRKYKALYSNTFHYSFEDQEQINNHKNMLFLLKYFNLPKRSFNFAGGTMFIAHKDFIDFFKSKNLIEIKKFLTPNNIYQADGLLEHAYERLFGYLFDYLDFKTLVLDYYEKS